MDEKDCKVPWHVVDASKSIDEVQLNINEIVKATLDEVKNGKPLYKMFDEGEYKLPLPSLKEECND